MTSTENYDSDGPADAVSRPVLPPIRLTAADMPVPYCPGTALNDGDATPRDNPSSGSDDSDDGSSSCRGSPPPKDGGEESNIRPPPPAMAAAAAPSPPVPRADPDGPPAVFLHAHVGEEVRRPSLLAPAPSPADLPVALAGAVAAA
eukprot:CAMPEP_0194281380 /NCGR_PEP_ID=MMETSP0169-20130528/20561_1 /TAXON_ID=218684 /ORGANISM="Corethron pennatum, Strain L29A3" /LENGTH=145 /DNA_ID=CAMNT_0039026413 /DNA_START=284 /DNA_END=717 /DNA_ORIENTATION=-